MPSLEPQHTVWPRGLTVEMVGVSLKPGDLHARALTSGARRSFNREQGLKRLASGETGIPFVPPLDAVALT